MACMGFAIAVSNLQQNKKQSTNDDLMSQLDHKTAHLISQLQKDIQEQNDILKDIVNRLDRLEKKNDS